MKADWVRYALTFDDRQANQSKDSSDGSETQLRVTRCFDGVPLLKRIGLV